MERSLSRAPLPVLPEWGLGATEWYDVSVGEMVAVLIWCVCPEGIPGRPCTARVEVTTAADRFRAAALQPL